MKTIVGKTAIIDLSARTVAVEDTPIQLVYHLLGGRGVNMAYLYRMLPLKTDALGPENVLIFGTGLLTGYPVPNSGRMNISAKSPESGILGDSNMGGFFPAAMKKSGFDRLVITGRANWPVYVLLSNGSVEIRDADPYWGLIVPDTQTALEQDLGKGVRGDRSRRGKPGSLCHRHERTKKCGRSLRNGGGDGVQEPEGGGCSRRCAP